MGDKCQHEAFSAKVNVARLEDKGLFMAEIRVVCDQCGIPFQFLGLEPGLDLQGARVSIDGLEANLAICPRGQKPSPLDRISMTIGRPGARHD